MSQHPSLLGRQKGKQHRSVLKRYERLKYLMEKDRWDKDSSVYSLPKIKSIRFKVKKEKAVAAEAAAAGTGEAAAGAAAGAGAQANVQPTAKPTVEKQTPSKDKKTK